MGRRKLRANEPCNAAFKARKDCLLKKASELSTLCGVEVGLIIYGQLAAATFPPDPDELKAVIARYRAAVQKPAKRKQVVEDFSGHQVAALLDKLSSKIEHVQGLIVSKEKIEQTGTALDLFSPEKQEAVSTAPFDLFPGEGFVDWDAVMSSVERSPPGEAFQDLGSLIDSIDFLFYGSPVPNPCPN